jgi:hypothetical protein
MNDSTQVAVHLKLDQANQLLAEAKTIQETKQIIDIAVSAVTYAKTRRLGEQAIRYANGIRLEALRRLGHLLKQTPRATGGDAQRTRFRKGTESPSTLYDLGIDKKVSMYAQQLAQLPTTLFEQVREGTVSMAMALRDVRRANGIEPPTVDWLESAEQVLRKTIHDLITDADAPPNSQQAITDLVQKLGDELKQAGRPELREAARIAKDELELRDSEPGAYKVFETEDQSSTHPGAPTVVAALKSTYPQWYRDLTTRKPGVTALRRKQVEARRNDIEAGTLPTKRTTNSYWTVVWAIKDLPRTSPLSRGGLT